MSPLMLPGPNCSSCDPRLVVDSPTSNPRMATLTTGRSIYAARMYTCYQSSQRTLGAFYTSTGWHCSQLYLRVIVVDSTRAGKRMPDALSKTIPIWCAVINRAIAKNFPSRIPPEWETNLFTPPGSVSRQEHYQIEKRIDGWVGDLVVNTYVNRPQIAF